MDKRTEQHLNEHRDTAAGHQLRLVVALCISCDHWPLPAAVNS